MFGHNETLKQISEATETLYVQEVFRTIQGEGPLSGIPSIFIRLAGCHLKCFFCDTDFTSSTWHPTIPEIVHAVLEKVETIGGAQVTQIVLTGGEPMRQNILELMYALNTLGLAVQIETAGNLHIEGIDSAIQEPHRGELSGAVNSIVCSPKTKRLHPKLVPLIGSYKYIVEADPATHSPVDGLPIASTQIEGQKQLIARPRNCDPKDTWKHADEVFIQPCDVQDNKKNKLNTLAAAELCLRYSYHLSLQIQKIVDLP